jgi:hypothetical protein
MENRLQGDDEAHAALPSFPYFSAPSPPLGPPPPSLPSDDHQHGGALTAALLQQPAACNDLLPLGGAEHLVPDEERQRHPGRRVPVEEVRAEGRQEQRPSQVRSIT